MTRVSLLVLLLAGCAAPVPAQTPLDKAANAVSEVLPAEQVAEQLDEVLPNLETLPPIDACRALAAELIVRWEVTSPTYYARALRYPIWPGGSSGVTWGVGYDGGHQVPRVIVDDWSAHSRVDELARTAGITGGNAKAALPRFRHIQTDYTLAYGVFRDRTLVEYERRAARTFRVDMAQLPAGVCAALVSVVYNRGAAMAGDSRREMRSIRDQCLPALDYRCVAGQIRAMSRLWVGTPNEAGLRNRRNDEARYAEMP